MLFMHISGECSWSIRGGGKGEGGKEGWRDGGMQSSGDAQHGVEWGEKGGWRDTYLWDTQQHESGYKKTRSGWISLMPITTFSY